VVRREEERAGGQKGASWSSEGSELVRGGEVCCEGGEAVGEHKMAVGGQSGFDGETGR
jgi:hypothetical protein